MFEERYVAVKICPLVSTRQYFKCATEALIGIKNVNIVDITDVQYDKTGTCFVIMEYVAGGDLLEYVQRRGRLSEVEALPIFTQLVAALQTSHAQGIYHLDLKPENILMDGSVVKLADFGTCLALDHLDYTYYHAGGRGGRGEGGGKDHISRHDGLDLSERGSSDSLMTTSSYGGLSHASTCSSAHGSDLGVDSRGPSPVCLPGTDGNTCRSRSNSYAEVLQEAQWQVMGESAIGHGHECTNCGGGNDAIPGIATKVDFGQHTDSLEAIYDEDDWEDMDAVEGSTAYLAPEWAGEQLDESLVQSLKQMLAGLCSSQKQRRRQQRRDLVQEQQQELLLQRRQQQLRQTRQTTRRILQEQEDQLQYKRAAVQETKADQSTRTCTWTCSSLSAIDTWALGVTLFVMCAGHTPWESSSALAAKNFTVENLPFPDWFSPSLCALLKRMFEAKPVNRIPLDEIMLEAWTQRDPQDTVLKFAGASPGAETLTGSPLTKAIPLVVPKLHQPTGAASVAGIRQNLPAV
jgi:serine/threonine protein kinase